MGNREARIRDEAYRLWEQAGRPGGAGEHYWHEAEKRVGASESAPDTGAAKAAGVRPKAVAKPRKGDVEGATSAPAPGPAGAKPKALVQSIANNAANSAVPSPTATPLKGERVDVAPVKTPKPQARPKQS